MVFFISALERSRCPYLILSAVHVVRSLKPWSWEAASPSVLNAKAKTCRSRCLFLRTEAVGIPLRQAVRAAVPVAQAVPVPAVVHAIDQEMPAGGMQLLA